MRSRRGSLALQTVPYVSISETTHSERDPRLAHLGWGLLAVSWLLRIALVVRGGPYYWPDERRYEVSRVLFDSLARGEIGTAVRIAASVPDHLGFKLIAVPLAGIQSGLEGGVTVPALFLCGVSVVNIALVERIARRSGAGAGEALLASVLFAGSASMFYYARHLLPYDLSLSFALLAIHAGLASPRDSRYVGCGVFAFLAFFTYAGYWTIAGLAMLLPLLHKPISLADTWQRALGVVFGFAAPAWCVVAIAIAGGGDVLGPLFAFSGTIDQGEFYEGWSLPFEYLWHAEHGLLLLFAVSGGVAARDLWRGAGPRRLVPWLAGAAFVYVCLALFSTGLELFVVYGRLARQLVPFGCWLGAYALVRGFEAPRARPWLPVAAAGLALQVAWNFSAPLRQVYPERFVREARERVAGETGRHSLLYIDHIYPAAEPVSSPPHDVVASSPHPLQYRPYQYDGYTPDGRASLRDVDITMRLIRLREAGSDTRGR